MNREAIALGTPVYTVFGGRVGAVDERLVADGRLLRLESAAGLDLDRLPPRRERLRRDPNVLLDLLID
jgi:predicted glycosyltransferase